MGVVMLEFGVGVLPVKMSRAWMLKRSPSLTEEGRREGSREEEGEEGEKEEEKESEEEEESGGVRRTAFEQRLPWIRESLWRVERERRRETKTFSMNEVGKVWLEEEEEEEGCIEWG